MKKMYLLFYALTLLIATSCNAKPIPNPAPEPVPAPQIVTPVKWTWKAEQTGKGEYKLIFNAKIDKGWHTYSQFIGEGGPVPTSLTFDKANKDVQLNGKATETGPKIHSGHDPVFDMELKSFENDLTIVQSVKVLKDTRLKGTLEFMVCDDSRCLPPDQLEFSFDLTAGKAEIKMEWDSTRSQNNILNPAQQKFDSAVQAVISKEVDNDSAGQNAAIALGGTNRFGSPQANCGATSSADDKSLLAVIILGFLGGLVALVTPCVFPMIPLTVSFFTKRSESKTKGKFEAFFYAFSIVFIYFLLAVPFLIFNISPDTLNEISTGAPLNVFFFVIFVVFAFSFFGFYEIQLPSFIANKADSASNVGGLVGIFFMALTLAIVSFSCTGPIIGSLLVGALSSANGKLNLIAGMTSFGVALALPFGLFALFPNMMKSLPKSGGWLNSVKVVLGFVELIFAIKFLSNADLVAHWGILKREAFLGLWLLFGTGLFVYLIGKLKFPHDSPVGKLSPVRISAAVVALLFTVYTAYGIPGNDLKLFSGFPPPKFYSFFKTESVIEPIKNDYAAALAKAKAEGKPLMIDFTGWACVNCRKMEENVWPNTEVLKRLSEKYVIVSLYVDDKEQLPDGEQYVSQAPNYAGKKVKTIGNKFSEMQAQYFQANTQPYYVLVSPDEKLLTSPKGYTPDVNEYVSFLDCGLNAYKELEGRTSMLGK
jgi:thiol:disulfide interchange protein DsbD